MMKVLYIGQYSEGSTSKMRADQLKYLLNTESFEIIDTHIPFYRTSRFQRSWGFRFKNGPLISNIHHFVSSELKIITNSFDLVWVDKAVFLKKDLIQELRRKTNKLVHFTPDMAFHENHSPHFEKSMHLYDFLVTTKSAEIKNYEEFIANEKLIITTQGFCKDKHYPTVPFKNKENSVAFIGLAEKFRFETADFLLENNIPLKIAGMGWDKFHKKHKQNPLLEYHGSGIYGEEYSRFFSSAKFGLGVLAKRIPEYHTTRTFEIPACGTALLTERNIETLSFFNEDEAIFYTNPQEMADKIVHYLKHHEDLEILTKKGLDRVNENGFDYETILDKILKKVL